VSDRTRRMRMWARVLWGLWGLFTVAGIFGPASLPEFPVLQVLGSVAIGCLIWGLMLWRRSDPAYDWRTHVDDRDKGDSPNNIGAPEIDDSELPHR
jgi:hypothetical protein